MEKKIEVEFEIGEEVIEKLTLFSRAAGTTISPLSSSEPVTSILAKGDGSKRYEFRGSWRKADSLIRKEDAQKKALEYLIRRIEFVSNCK